MVCEVFINVKKGAAEMSVCVFSHCCFEQKFYEPIVAVAHRRCILRAEDIPVIFCNFDQNILPVASMLCELLRPRVQNWDIDTPVSDVFLQIVRYFIPIL